jgi:hypothetical protein
MTKERTPLTYEDAVNRVIGTIGMTAASEATGRSADYLRALTDPDKRYTLTIEDAEKLDLAWQATGQSGAPIFELYGLRMEIAQSARFASRFTFLGAIATYITESGDATGAIIRAALPGAGHKEVKTAQRELIEAFEAMRDLFPFLESDLAAAKKDPA